MKIQAIISFLFLANFSLGACLNDASIQLLGFESAGSLTEYTDTEPEHCTTSWKEHGSCIVTDKFLEVIIGNLKAMNEKGGKQLGHMIKVIKSERGKIKNVADKVKEKRTKEKADGEKPDGKKPDGEKPDGEKPKPGEKRGKKEAFDEDDEKLAEAIKAVLGDDATFEDFKALMENKETRKECNKATKELVKNSYCMLTSGNASNYAVTGADGKITTLNIDDADSLNVYNSCKDVYYVSCVFMQIKTLLNESSDNPIEPDEKMQQQVENCTIYSNCVSSGDNSACTDKIKARLLEYFIKLNDFVLSGDENVPDPEETVDQAETNAAETRRLLEGEGGALSLIHI